MKNNITNTILAVLFSTLLFSCGQEIKEENAKLKNDNTSLINTIKGKEETIAEFITTFNSISENLDKIKEKEEIISINASEGGEINKNIKDKINTDIQDIYTYIEENKKNLASFEQKLKNAKIEAVELKKAIEGLKKLIEEKDLEIATLKEELAKLNIVITDLVAVVDTLSKKNTEKDNLINEKIEEINTAYYIVGNEKALREKGIITKEGGFIGIGRIEKIGSDVNKKDFVKVDITKISTIDINKKKVRIITNHPSSAYSLKVNSDKITEKLMIKNQKDFWSVSKYMVIVTE